MKTTKEEHKKWRRIAAIGSPIVRLMNDLEAAEARADAERTASEQLVLQVAQLGARAGAAEAEVVRLRTEKEALRIERDGLEGNAAEFLAADKAELVSRREECEKLRAIAALSAPETDDAAVERAGIEVQAAVIGLGLSRLLGSLTLPECDRIARAALTAARRSP